MRRVLYACAAILSAGVIFSVVLLFVREEDDRYARLDQICQLFETSHLRDVQELRKTYDYLGQTRGDHSTIRRFVLLNLPSQEHQARTDSAPEFCDHNGLGRPEPDPVVPRRPPNLK